jgi:hypothetical protein
MIKLLTQDAIDAILQKTIFDAYAEEAIAEAKEYDKPHGTKLSHKILDRFFTQTAPKLNSLAAVESALKALYKENGVPVEVSGIKQVISSYKKRLQEGELTEVALSSAEKKSKDKLVIALKKSAKEYRMRFKDEETADIHNLATAIVKNK